MDMNKKTMKIIGIILAAVIVVIFIMLITFNNKSDENTPQPFDSITEEKVESENTDADLEGKDLDGEGYEIDDDQNVLDKIFDGKNKNNNKSDSDKSSGTSSDNGSVPSGKMTYEKYLAMSPEKQEAYFETFDDPDDFIKWYNAAKAEYDATHEGEEVEGGGIDIGDYQ